MSGVAVFVVAVIVFALTVAYLVEVSRVDLEHQLREQAEAERDAFESLYLRDTFDRIDR